MRVRRRVGVCVAMAALAASGGCGGGQPAGGGRAGAADVDSLPLLALRRDLRVGSVDNPDSGFSRIAGVAVGPDSLVYVLDSQARQVRVYDPSGRRVGTIGRQGQGPGEFAFPAEMGLKGDTLWVADMQEQRMTLFSRKGDVLATIPTPPVLVDRGTGFFVEVYVSRLRDDGTLGGSPIMGFMAGSPPSARRSDSVVVPDLVFDRHGHVVDTLGMVTLPLPRGSTIKLAGKNVSVPAAPGDAPLRIPGVRGQAVVERPSVAASGMGSFTVTRMGANGDTIYRRSYAYRPRGFPPAFLDSLVRSSVPYAVRLTQLDTAAVERALREAVELPPFQPPVSRAEVGVDGSIWLRREDDGGPTFRWDVLDPRGAPVGRIELPRDVTILWARMGEIYGAAVDSLGVPWLVRYRVGGMKG